MIVEIKNDIAIVHLARADHLQVQVKETFPRKRTRKLTHSGADQNRMMIDTPDHHHVEIVRIHVIDVIFIKEADRIPDKFDAEAQVEIDQ